MEGLSKLEAFRCLVEGRSLLFRVIDGKFHFKFEVGDAYEGHDDKIDIFVNLDCAEVPFEFAWDELPIVEDHIRKEIENEFPQFEGCFGKVSCLEIIVMHPLTFPMDDQKMIEQIVLLCWYKGLSAEESRRMMRRTIRRIDELSGEERDGNGVAYMA